VVNEIAPRPHNSGHYTIEACPTFSQYKSQLLSILGIMPPFPNATIPAMFPSAVMLNILGGASKDSHKELMKRAVATPNAALHMYGKESKPARKIGHITVVANSMSEGMLHFPVLKLMWKSCSPAWRTHFTSMYSNGKINANIVSAEHLITPLIQLVDNMRASRKDLPTSTISPSPPLLPQPLVAVTMGSDSDLPVLKPGLELLTTLGIPFHVTITSAHRTPLRMTEFASSAVANGFKVIIAAAGGAAHLPGMIAASTPLPVIGVPVKGSTLDGMDSLLSIVQVSLFSY